MTLKYKAGDTVEITDMLHGHEYKIGAHVVIESTDFCDEDYYGGPSEPSKPLWTGEGWYFSEDECKLVKAKEE